MRHLTDAQRSLIQIMRENHFGRIESIRVHSGALLLDSDVRVVRVSRLGAEPGARNLACADESDLNQAVLDLFAELERLENGSIVRIEFRHGLPCLIETVAPIAGLPER
jgi:hypothetical protein